MLVKREPQLGSNIYPDKHKLYHRILCSMDFEASVLVNIVPYWKSSPRRSFRAVWVGIRLL